MTSWHRFDSVVGERDRALRRVVELEDELARARNLAAGLEWELHEAVEELAELRDEVVVLRRRGEIRARTRHPSTKPPPG